MDLLDKLEWAYHTIDAQLKFGLEGSQAIRARERRVKGVLIDAIKELKAGALITEAEFDEAWKDEDDYLKNFTGPKGRIKRALFKSTIS